MHGSSSQTPSSCRDAESLCLSLQVHLLALCHPALLFFPKPSILWVPLSTTSLPPPALVIRRLTIAPACSFTLLIKMLNKAKLVLPLPCDTEQTPSQLATLLLCSSAAPGAIPLLRSACRNSPDKLPWGGGSRFFPNGEEPDYPEGSNLQPHILRRSCRGPRGPQKSVRHSRAWLLVLPPLWHKGTGLHEWKDALLLTVT